MFANLQFFLKFSRKIAQYAIHVKKLPTLLREYGLFSRYYLTVAVSLVILQPDSIYTFP